MEKHREIFVEMKRIVMTVVARNSDLTMCCPGFSCEEEELQTRLQKLAASQREVDLAITSFRFATEERFADFSDCEILLLVHLWSGLWSSDSALRVTSSSLMDILGNNQVEEAGELITSLLNRSSHVFRFISDRWEPGRRNPGEYVYQVHDLEGLHHLILGDLTPTKA